MGPSLQASPPNQELVGCRKWVMIRVYTGAIHGTRFTEGRYPSGHGPQGSKAAGSLSSLQFGIIPLYGQGYRSSDFSLSERWQRCFLSMGDWIYHSVEFLSAGSPSSMCPVLLLAKSVKSWHQKRTSEGNISLCLFFLMGKRWLGPQNSLRRKCL